MKITIEDQAKIRTILLRTITSEGADWLKIVEQINQEIQIKNWLKVRAVLQGLLQDGLVKRTHDLTTERYVSIC